MQVVVGLGKTGYSCVEYFARNAQPVRVVDTRAFPPFLEKLRENYPNVPVSLAVTDKYALLDAERVVVSPGLSIDTPMISKAIAEGIPCVSDVEIFAEAVDAPVIAITGTNGKTTTVSLIHHIIQSCGYKALLGGNIGIPVLSLLERPNPDYYVLELSSFQLELISSLKPKVAVLLNFSPDHIDHHFSVDAYRKAKQRIYLGCDVAVCNADEPLLWSDLSLDPVLSFSLTNYNNSDFFVDTNGMIHSPYGDVSVAELTSKSVINLQNVLASLVVGYSLGLKFSSVCQAIRSFKGLPHRCEFVDIVSGVSFYNDSKATNAGAVISALNFLSIKHKKIILIAGGDAKGADVTSLIPYVNKHVYHLVLLGKDKDLFANVFKEIPHVIVDCMADAVKKASSLAAPGGVVLLSPACASWDMYQNYQERGNVFIAAVNQLKGV